MSDGITLYCPGCGELAALKKEYDQLEVKLRLHNVKEVLWYDSSIPVYTCQKCGKAWAIERVSK